MEEEIEVKDYCQRLIESTEESVNRILDEGIRVDNLDYLSKLVDIHKDVCNEEYWKVKKEDIEMRYDNRRYMGGDGNEYGNYGNYGNYGTYGRRARDSRGRYTMRGRDSKYRGEEMMEDMSESYGRYLDGRERYGSDESTLKSLNQMLTSVEEFMKHLEENADSEEEMTMIKETAQRISRM